MNFDILIKNARTRFSKEKLLDIGIKEGRIVKIGENIDGTGSQLIDAAGKLVTESFVNGLRHVATSPVDLPDRRAASSTVATGRHCSVSGSATGSGKSNESGRIERHFALSELSHVLYPVANAVAAAADSVIMELAECVRTRLISIESWASGAPLNHRAIVMCAMPQPSGTSTMTLWKLSASCCAP